MARRRIWLASSISRISSSVEPSIGFSFFFICSALRAWIFLSCWRVLSISGSWLSSCWAWVRASSTYLSSPSRASLIADRWEILCFSSSPEDCRMLMLLCFSLVVRFTCITFSVSRAWAALSARHWVAFWYWSWRLSKCAAWKMTSSTSAGIWPRIVLNKALAGSESSTNWAVSWCSRANKSSSFA